MQLTNWEPIRFWGLRGEGTNFIDAEQVIKWTQCYKDVGDQIFSAQGYCSGYIYGKIIPILFTVVPEGRFLVSLLGFSFLIIVSIVLGSTTASMQSNQLKALSITAFLSPPILLLVERGNFDSLMLGLTFYAAYLFSKKRKIISFLLLALSSLVKFYTFPLMAAFFLQKTKRKSNYLYVPGLLIIFFLVLTEIRAIKSSFPNDSTYKFGMSIWVRYLPIERIPFNINVLANLVGLALLAFISAAMLIVYKRGLWPVNYSMLDKSTTNFYVFNFLFLCHFICFFSGMSYDYRLVFLAISAVIFLSLNVLSNSAESATKTLLLLSMWLTYPSGGLQPFGDLAICALTLVLSLEFLKLNSVKLSSIKLFQGTKNDF